MAKIHTETVELQVSRLVKESDTPDSVVTEDIVATLQEVADQLFPGCVVEVEAK